MTLERSKNKLAAALVGAGLAVALALSSTATARADVIDDLATEFTTAQGAGQVSSLLNQSMKLRQMGFKPTNGEIAAIEDALRYRPNQTPMINALQDAVAGQTKRLQQAQAAAGDGPFTIGINQYDPNSPGGVSIGPGGINIGGAPHQIGDGRAPGQVVGPPRG